MTFEHPYALALAAAIPLLWWLHRRRAPRIVRVASLDPYRESAGAPQPAAEHRAADPVLLLLLAAACAAVLAAAGPRWTTSKPGVRLVVDRSPSMSMRLEPPAMESIGEHALGRARRCVASAVGPHDEEIVDAAGEADLGAAVAAARAAGYAGVVFVTDRPPEVAPEGVVVAASGIARNANAAIVRAWLAGGGARIAVRNFGPGRVQVALGADRRALPPGDESVFEIPAPERGTAVSVSFRADDAFAPDNVATLRRVGGARRVRLVGESVSVRAALRALEVQIAEDGANSDAIVVIGGEIAAAAGATVHVAPRGSAPAAPLTVRDAAATPDAANLVLGSGTDFPLPPSSARLVAHVRLVGGDALVSARDGALVARHGIVVAIALDPDAPDSDWARDGSFVAALGAALDLVTDGPDRLVFAPGADPAESATPSVVTDAPSPDALRGVVRPSGSTDLSALAAAAAAVCAVLAAALGSRRSAGA